LPSRLPSAIEFFKEIAAALCGWPGDQNPPNDGILSHPSPAPWGSNYTIPPTPHKGFRVDGAKLKNYFIPDLAEEIQ
jgi:hypothetical protein